MVMKTYLTNHCCHHSSPAASAPTVSAPRRAGSSGLCSMGYDSCWCTTPSSPWSRSRRSGDWTRSCPCRPAWAGRRGGSCWWQPQTSLPENTPDPHRRTGCDWIWDWCIALGRKLKYKIASKNQMQKMMPWYAYMHWLGLLWGGLSTGPGRRQTQWGMKPSKQAVEASWYHEEFLSSFSQLLTASVWGASVSLSWSEAALLRGWGSLQSWPGLLGLDARRHYWLGSSQDKSQPRWWGGMKDGATLLHLRRYWQIGW